MINKDGKVFGKINIIDLIVGIILLIVVVAGGIMAMNMYKSKRMVSQSGGKNIVSMYVTVTADGIKEEISNAFVVGDKLVTGNDILINEEIVSVETLPLEKFHTTDEGELVIFEDPFLNTVNIVVKGSIDLNQGNNKSKSEINGQEARVGNMVFIKTEKALISGRIIDIEYKE